MTTMRDRKRRPGRCPLPDPEGYSSGELDNFVLGISRPFWGVRQMTAMLVEVAK